MIVHGGEFTFEIGNQTWVVKLMMLRREGTHLVSHGSAMRGHSDQGSGASQQYRETSIKIYGNQYSSLSTHYAMNKQSVPYN